MGFHEPPPQTQHAAAVHAWQQVLGHLRAQLNRADFETWVRDAQVVAYDGQVLTLGVGNAYARDWLAQHLREEVERLLRPHLAAPVQVVFRVVSAGAPAETGPRSGTVVPQAQAPPALDLSLVQQRLREALQQSHRVIFLPGYFLRWVPLLGTRAAWLYVALRQAYFLSYRQPHGPQTRLTGQAVEVTREVLARWAHLTPRTINNLLNKNLLAPLVRVERDRHLQANRQAPNRYTFTADLPLTPHDRARVLAFLHRHGWPDNPVTALARTLEAAPHGLIPTPRAFILEPNEPPAPAYHASLRDVLAADLPANLPPEIQRQVLSMAELLESTLVETWGKLFVSWYFTQHHLPRLGHTFAWLYLTARHLAERNGRAVGRGFRLLETTTAAAAAWVGIEKVRYVRELIPPAPLDTPLNPLEAPPEDFLRRLPGRGSTLTLAVQTVEPLTPADEKAYRLALDALGSCIQRRDFHPLEALREKMQGGKIEQALVLLQERLSTPAATPPPRDILLRAAEVLAMISTETPLFSSGNGAGSPQERRGSPAEGPKTSPGSAPNFPRNDQKMPPEAPQTSPDSAPNFPHFNSVNPSSPENNLTSTYREPTDWRAAVTKGPQTSPAGSQSGWSWSLLLQNPHLNPKVAQDLQQHPPEHFVAWLLYACTQQARGVEHPLGLAIHATRQGRSPSGVFERLARLGPAALQDLLWRHLNYGFAAARSVHPDWEAMANCSQEMLLTLIAYLALEAT